MDKSKAQKKLKESLTKDWNRTGDPAPNDNLNHEHNTKKVALGPNTKR